jgi:PTH1 family peptidyl-tRNA hydrolase
VYLIAGLGNPGQEYTDTRHNIGFAVINLLARQLGVHLTGRRFQSVSKRTRLGGKPVLLLCPQTFMNESGKAVRACASYYDTTYENIVLIHDDLDLPLGRIKVVKGGGAGGHKGVKSVIRHLGSMQFPRIKIGIGRQRFGEGVEDYVLRPFYDDEKVIVEKVLSTATHACELIVSTGVESAMNCINTRSFENKEEKE